MPSSYHRPSPATGRRTHTTSHAQDMDETLLEKLKDSNTELNKVTSERDRYVRLYEQATQKLSESHVAKEDFKAQVHALKEENDALRRKLQESKRENKKLTCDVDALYHENDTLQHENDTLQHAYDDLFAKYDAATSPSGQGTSMRLPERPKSSHKSSSKREHKEERTHKGDKETREKKAEKERLSRRFDKERPGARGRRQSFIEPWGSGARPVSSAPARDYADIPVQAVQLSHSNVAFSTVPRTTNPLGSSLYKPGGGLYDDEFEDGNYRAYPVAR